MKSRKAGRLLGFAVGALLMLPAAGYAQEATLSGTVSDTTGGVLPGVTVVGVHEATGNTFESVTDGTGRYRMPVRIGGYAITAALPGFQTVTQTGVAVQVGQTATVDLQLGVSTLQETITVTGEAPLIDVTNSTMSANIDARQVADLPIQGRDWTSLALLAPGNRTTEVGDTPVQDRGDVREYHLNMDGQQVTQTMGIGGQPLYSRDSIAEFQFISNRFDATQGRSSGVLVNAVTKSGTNAYSGLVSGYFRDSDWGTSESFVSGTVLPYSNQQISTTLGGPIVLDKLHFFANFEMEREPKTSIWTTPYPAFNLSIEGQRAKRIGGIRTDYQISSGTRLMAKYHRTRDDNPFGTGRSNQHPSSSDRVFRRSNEYLGQLTSVLNNRTLNEIKVGYSWWNVIQEPAFTSWSDHPRLSVIGDLRSGGPQIRFRHPENGNFTFGGNSNRPREREQNMSMFRDDFTTSYDAGGRHDVKIGGEYLYYYENSQNCRRCSGRFTARSRSLGFPDDIETIFPDHTNADTWDLDAISPYVQYLQIGISNDYRTDFPIHRTAAWYQDDWAISDNLTLNLGVRYDLIKNGWANEFELEPWLQGGRKDDTNNIQPRIGFAYTVNDSTVLRGGGGIYFGDLLSNMHLWTMGSTTFAVIRVNNDGRSDFVSNPFNGPAPTQDQAFARFCNVSTAASCLTPEANEIAPPQEYSNVTRSYQGSFGMAHQLRGDMAIEVDYVYTGSRDEKVIQGNANLTFNEATGLNYPFSDESTRVEPLWGVVSMTPYAGRSDYNALQTVVTKRFSNRWQASANYTLGALKNADPLPMSGLRQVTFNVARDLGNEYTLAATDQRHRLVFNGIWEVAGGLQLSGLYFYGSGERRNTDAGGDNRDLGDGPERLLAFGDGGFGGLAVCNSADGCIVPRANFVGDPVHRVDMRLQQRIPIGGNLSLDGMLEVFNVFNHRNIGSYETDYSSNQFGDPNQSNNLAYAARQLQLGFRLAF
jgi:hypothetical protein